MDGCITDFMSYQFFYRLVYPRFLLLYPKISLTQPNLSFNYIGNFQLHVIVISQSVSMVELGKYNISTALILRTPGRTVFTCLSALF